jgi:predicted DsbA family dithiol-disulfide isomerase
MRHASEADIDTGVLRSALAGGSARAFLAEAESVGARMGVRATPCTGFYSAYGVMS